MNIESKKYKIESAAAFGAGFILTKKAGKAGPAWNLFIAKAPSPQALALMSESQFDREAAAAFIAGAWE